MHWRYYCSLYCPLQSTTVLENIARATQFGFSRRPEICHLAQSVSVTMPNSFNLHFHELRLTSSTTDIHDPRSLILGRCSL
jgi:hypothetical protein